MTIDKKKAAAKLKAAREQRKAALAEGKRMITVTRDNLASAKQHGHGDYEGLPIASAHDLEILEDLHERAKEIYAGLPR